MSNFISDFEIKDSMNVLLRIQEIYIGRPALHDIVTFVTVVLPFK